MFVSNISILIFFILTIIISVNSSVLKEDDQLSLIQVEYGYNITNFSMEVLNRDDAEINDFLSSRIACMNGSDYDNEIFELYSSYINKFWIFLVNSSSVADNLLQRNDYKKNELYINGIIVPESLNYKMPSENNNKKIPIFILKDDIIEKLAAYDIRYMNKHTYFLFEIKRAISNYPEVYFLVISILLLVGSFAMIIFWKVRMKSFSGANTFKIDKFLYTIPFFIFLLAIALIVKAMDIRGKDPNREYEDSIYIDTALITLSAIFKTILWFIILLIACGWKISVQTLSREELKFLMKMFLLIYIVMCLDQIIDSTRVKVWVFHLSEIKNIIYFAGMTFLLLRKIKRTLNFLYRKLYYSRLLNMDYVEAFVFKIKLVKKFKWMLFFYLSYYALFMLMHKTALAPYDTSLLETYDYTLVDVYLSAHLLFLFRPQQLPHNFNVDFGNDMDEDICLLYKAFLPKYNMINTLFKEEKEDIKSLKNKNIPILILGPCVSHYDAGGKEEVSLNNYINNIGIGFAT